MSVGNEPRVHTHTHTHTQETTMVLFSTILQVFHMARKRLQLLAFPALIPLAPLPAVISKQSFIRQLGLIRAETSVIQGGAPSLPQKSFRDERGPDHCCLRFGLLQWAGEMKWFGEAGSGGNNMRTAWWWANYLAPLPPRTVCKEDAISQLRPCPSVPLSSLLKTSISKGSLERERNLLWLLNVTLVLPANDLIKLY